MHSENQPPSSRSSVSPAQKPNDLPYLIFADGACSGNPGPGGWGAIVVTPAGAVTELGGSEVPSTNNRMELLAAICAIESLKGISKSDPIEIFTDSSYVIRGMTQWIWGWRKRGWITAEGKSVANVELWKRLSEVTAYRSIQWKYVRGHSGIPGNERVDQIAVDFAQGRRPSLYRGPLLKYDIAIYDIPENTELPDRPAQKSAAPKTQAYSYLSLVGNQAMRHSTWPECERRVKGQSGARFKKAMSPSDEAQILQGWGLTLGDLKEK